MKRTVIFGVGNIFNKNKDFLFDNYNIVGVIDNDYFSYGMYVFGIMVSKPIMIKTLQYDMVIITPQNQTEIVSQLKDMGIPSEKIFDIRDLISFNTNTHCFNEYQPSINHYDLVQSSFSSPLISIIIPVYNNERYLSKAIESVINQDFKDIELIIVNDGSTDNTPKIANEFAQKDTRVRVIHQENKYVYAALNNGISQASGEYVFHLNSDDTLYSNSLHTMADIVTKYNPDVIYTKVLSHQCDENQRIIQYDCPNWDVLVESDAFYKTKDDFRNNYIYLYKSRVSYNSANLYRATIAKNHEFRNDIYGADLLFNVQIANDINSAYVCAAPIYNHFMYENTTNNISLGKWYGYLNEMVTDFYNEHVKLFNNWNIWNDMIEQTLASDRLSDFSMVCKSLLAYNCNLESEIKLRKVFCESIDDTVYNCGTKFGRIGELERIVFSFCGELFAKESVCEDSDFYFVFEMFEVLQKSERTDEDLQKLKRGAYHSSNPWHIGKIYLP